MEQTFLSPAKVAYVAPAKAKLIQGNVNMDLNYSFGTRWSRKWIYIDVSIPPYYIWNLYRFWPKVTFMNRTTIINAAAGLFESKGYSATSMRDLAEKVGLMPSSLYSHINSKQEILKEICMQCAYQFTDGMLELKQNNNNPQQSIDALIKLHVDIVIHFLHPLLCSTMNGALWKQKI